jgi:hypothetical protein
MWKMEGAENSKKVKKEKRSVKKTKAVAVPATETPAASIAEPEPVAKAKGKNKSAKKAAPDVKVQEPTFEEIQRQAYFIAERRARLGVPGDATSDWVEAEAVLKAQLTSK